MKFVGNFQEDLEEFEIVFAF